MDQYHLNQFHTLLQHSTSLLHGGNGADWKTYIVATACPSEEDVAVVGGDDNGGNVNVNGIANEGVGGNEAMEEEESDSDDDMMMLGGCFSDSDDDDDETAAAAASTSTSAGSKDTAFANLDLGSDEDNCLNEEEDSLLLKRAASVHSALLLSMPQPQPGANINGRELVEQLVGAMQEGNDDDDDNASLLQELISILSFCISSSSSLDSTSTRPKSISVSQERWKKVCLTNALLAIQFLLHLMKQQQQQSSGGNEDTETLMSSVSSSVGALDEWNVVILPLLFGNNKQQCRVETTTSTTTSLFLMNDALRDALLNLSSTSSSLSNTSTSANQSNNGSDSEATVTLCLEALHNATFSTTAASMPTMMLRQKNIIVVCQVLVNLLDNNLNLKKKNNNNQVQENDDDVDIVREGLHKAVLMILRGICYESSSSSSATTSSSLSSSFFSKPCLNLESLRGVTGMLLPKLYPVVEEAEKDKNNKKGSGSSGGVVAEKQSVELWNEILLLLGPYSEKDVEEEEETAQVSIGDMGKRRCCKNWYVLINGCT